ncbi:unnamed protein product [Amoebophrya sp. A120]|nr:unnamed protein product [Amoebophrya sp. A120]|eukprot:GSA120T00003345001.1
MSAAATDVDYDGYVAALRAEGGSSMDDLRRAFRKLALQAHPDKPGGSADRFRALVRAAERVEAELNGDVELNGAGAPATAPSRASSGAASSFGAAAGRPPAAGSSGPKRRKEDWVNLGSEKWVGGGRTSTASSSAALRVNRGSRFESATDENSEEEIVDARFVDLRFADLKFTDGGESRQKPRSERWTVRGSTTSSGNNLPGAGGRDSKNVGDSDIVGTRNKTGSTSSAKIPLTSSKNPGVEQEPKPDERPKSRFLKKASCAACSII